MSLSPPSQLLERNNHLFEQGEWLIINPADSAVGQILPDRPIHFLHQYFDIFSQFARVINSLPLDSRDVSTNANGFICRQQVGQQLHSFAPFLTGEALATDVMIYVPKAKAHLSMLISMAASLLAPEGRIYVVGENKSGIKSVAKLLTKYGTVDKLDSARHCSLICCHVEQAKQAFNIESWSREDEFSLANTQWQIYSLPGVFSHGELDSGTRLLLEKLPSIPSGSILDFACGAGVIASYLLSQSNALRATLLDVSALAIYCAAKTAQLNNQQVALIAADNIGAVQEKYSAIITNPPFHTGVKTDYSITRKFIQLASQHLSKDGAMYMVANRFLPYQVLLAEQFESVNTVGQTSQFSVYKAQRA